MKIDQPYLKQMLNVFIESKNSHIWVAEMTEAGIEMDDKFLFHIQILEDQGFIECLDKTSDIGYEIVLNGQFRWHSRPLRLTSSGHEFVEALNQAEIWNIITSEFQNSSLETLKSAASSLLKAFARKQISKYLDL